MYSFPQMRVLVVDDDFDVANILAELLRVFGMETHVVHDGPTAIKEVDKWKPDVVFMDIRMPVLDGYETTRIIRESAEAKHVPIYSLSGWTGEQPNRLERQRLFDGQLVKPATIESIGKALLEVAHRKSVNR